MSETTLAKVVQPKNPYYYFYFFLIIEFFLIFFTVKIIITK